MANTAILSERQGKDQTGLTNEDLPVLDSLCDGVGTPHLRVGHATYDEDDEARHWLVALLAFLLVPLAVASTGHKK